MIGWINLSVEAFICDSFGRDAWLEIIKQAHVDCNWVSSCPYPDKVTYDLVITGAGILGVTVPQALEVYGQYFVNYVIKQGYTRLMKSLGSNIAEFLANLNNLHLHLTLGFPSMVAPAFRVEQVTSISLLLHYHSIRPALWPIVSGVLKGASKVLFNHEVEMELVASRDAGDCDHEIFRVTYPHQEALSDWDDHGAALASEYGMTKGFFYDMFPFHVILDRECRVVQAGRVMRRLFGKTLTRGSLIADTFKLRHPYIPFEYDKMVLEGDSLYLLKALQTGLEFKGQMVQTNMPDDGGPVLLFLGSPRVATLEEMDLHGLYLSDIPLHDMSRDFVLLAEQRQAEADLKERFEKMAVELRLANARLEEATSWLAAERQRSDALLYRMLPADIAADLREGRKVEAISYPEVTILFSDMVGFTTTSARSTPEEVYDMLNEMYDKFDSLVDDFPDVYKLETIGDAYFLVCNLTTECHNHVDVVIDFAIRMQDKARHVKDAQGEPVQIRIGIHTGPVVGGVLGAKTPRFSIYGDTVNVASRMESHGLPGKIHISDASYNRIVDKGKYAVRERGNIAVKGRGNTRTYLIGGTNDDWLLRHNSFDAQIGGGVGERDDSFIVIASGRSMDNLLAPGRQLALAMESIKEGDEGKWGGYSPAGSRGGANVGTSTGGCGGGASGGGGASAAPLVVSVAAMGNASAGNSASLSRGAAALAAANASGGGVGGGGGGGGGGVVMWNSGNVQIPHAPKAGAGGASGAATATNSAEALGCVEAPAGAVQAAAPHAHGGPLPGGGNNRDGGTTMPAGVRDGHTLMTQGSMGRDAAPRENSFQGRGENSLLGTREMPVRAVYARGGTAGRQSSSNLTVMMSQSSSRKMHANVVTGLMAAGSAQAGGCGAAADSDAASATSVASSHGGGGTTTHDLAARRVPSTSQIHEGDEVSTALRSDASGSMSSFGAGLQGGMVKARSATAKASPLAPASQPAIQAQGRVAGAAAAEGSSPDSVSARRPVPQPILVAGSGALNSTNTRLPSPDAGAGPSPAGTRSSDKDGLVVSGGSSGAATPTGKTKGLAGKLRSLFKK